MKRFYLVFILVFCFSSSNAFKLEENCLENPNICNRGEYCNHGNCLPFPNEESEYPLEKVERSEVLIDTPINTPIRIHKYNLDDYDYLPNKIDDVFNDYESKKDSDSNESYEYDQENNNDIIENDEDQDQYSKTISENKKIIQNLISDLIYKNELTKRQVYGDQFVHSIKRSNLIGQDLSNEDDEDKENELKELKEERHVIDNYLKEKKLEKELLEYELLNLVNSNNKDLIDYNDDDDDDDDDDNDSNDDVDDDKLKIQKIYPIENSDESNENPFENEAISRTLRSYDLSQSDDVDLNSENNFDNIDEENYNDDEADLEEYENAKQDLINNLVALSESKKSNELTQSDEESNTQNEKVIFNRILEKINDKENLRIDPDLINKLFSKSNPESEENLKEITNDLNSSENEDVDYGSNDELNEKFSRETRDSNKLDSDDFDLLSDIIDTKFGDNNSFEIDEIKILEPKHMSKGEISNGPIIIEREGLDRNGNRFYEQNFQYKNQKHIPDNLESVDLDYFEAPKLQKSKRRFNTEDRTIQDNDDALNQINFIEGLLESISNPTFNQKNVYDEKFFQNFFESSEKTEQMPIKVKNEINDEIQSDLLSKLIKDNLEKENNLLKPNQNQQKLENLFDKINEKETVTEKPENKEALNKLKERLEANENRIAENLHSINSRNSIEKRPFSAFTDLDSMTNEELVDDSYIYIELDKKITEEEAKDLVGYIAQFTFIPLEWFKDISINENLVLFKIDNQDVNLNHVVNEIIKNKENILQDKRLKIISSNRGNVILNDLYKNSDESKYFLIVTIVICGSVIVLLVSLIAVFVVKRRTHLRNKLIDDVSSMKKKKQEDEESLVESEKKSKIERIKSAWPFSKLTFKKENVQENLSTDDYEKLCRQEMQTKKNQSIVSPLNSTRCTDINTPNLFSPVPLNSAGNVISTPLTATCEDRNVVSTRSSTSSWSEEPVGCSSIDVSTGHAILAYMEDHLNNKSRLDKEWEDLCIYEADLNETNVAKQAENMSKNRYSNVLPFDHNRIKLKNKKENETDYINASIITDDDPKNAAYIATQGPLIHTTNDFWQMAWEKNCNLIISLCRTVEYGSLKCNQYWPANGSEIYGYFEVNLVSEHVYCEDYLVRSFYVKNLIANESRTITQFHFLTWPENDTPKSIKSILDFRRKVEKSYKCKSSPILVHCNDGIGRTGTYILIDMILKKVVKGAKEIDLAATLEYLRDQRPNILKNKKQFEFSFSVITEEVHNMLNSVDDP